MRYWELLGSVTISRAAAEPCAASSLGLNLDGLLGLSGVQKLALKF